VGFAESSTISLVSTWPDVYNSNWGSYGDPAMCSQRLSWHLDYGSIGGWRAGCTHSLNTDPTWRKVIYTWSSGVSLPPSPPPPSPPPYPYWWADGHQLTSASDYQLNSAPPSTHSSSDVGETWSTTDTQTSTTSTETSTTDTDTSRPSPYDPAISDETETETVTETNTETDKNSDDTRTDQTVPGATTGDATLDETAAPDETIMDSSGTVMMTGATQTDEATPEETQLDGTKLDESLLDETLHEGTQTDEAKN